MGARPFRSRLARFITRLGLAAGAFRARGLAAPGLVVGEGLGRPLGTALRLGLARNLGGLGRLGRQARALGCLMAAAHGWTSDRGLLLSPRFGFDGENAAFGFVR